MDSSFTNKDIFGKYMMGFITYFLLKVS